MEDIKKNHRWIFFKNEQGDLNVLGGKIIKIALIFVIIRIISRLINKIIDETLNNKKNKSSINW